MPNKNNICFVVPSLRGGGMERVVSVLSNHLSRKLNQSITIILLSKQEIFYEIDSKVEIIEQTYILDILDYSFTFVRI
jgi:GalNAc-alpha-(1->4)-GalNAc-alpha-(1->3)-diNAcBac-PP-undecaprenol alpha-1,4-N-acetyl-D-galactosaminyltransferase